MSRPTSPTAVSTNYVGNAVDSQRLVRHGGNQVRTQNGRVRKRP